MKTKSNIHKLLLLRLVIILVLLSVSRFFLFFANQEFFAEFSFSEISSVFFNGLRFDISVMCMLSSLLIVVNTLPVISRKNPILQKITNIITLFAVSLALIFNLSDAIYFRFTLKRMTFDIFNYLNTNCGLSNMLPKFLLDFWPILLSAVVLIVILIFAFVKIKLNDEKEKSGWSFYLKNTVIFLFSITLIILGIRGGTGKQQLKPLDIIDAAKYAPAKLSPLVLNTPFTIIRTIGKQKLEVKNTFTQDELDQIYNPIQSYSPLDNVSDSVRNVVVIILESFSAEHIGYFNNGEGYTPFLDSLFNHSLVFSAIANGKRSVDGIPAVLSSLPTMSDASFINSQYSANKIEGLAKTLSKHNYNTSFFHGGENGTMNFNSYSANAGFQKYFGLNEYPNKKDYDGFWGIWDEPYLKYFAKTIDSFPEPFFTTLFTLSSHHPFNVPDQYKNTLKSGPSKIQQTIAYTDQSLRKFFEIAQTKEWFQNTMFVFSADHTSEGILPKYKNSLGQFTIPIAFYIPADSSLKTRKTRSLIEQIDIFPSVINYLGIKDSILCFGNSVFDTSSYNFGMNYSNNTFQIYDNEYLLRISDNKAISAYRYKEDSLLQNNILKTVDLSRLMTFQQAFIQQYNNRMIENNLTFRFEKN